MAEIPNNLKFLDSHEWARLEDDGTVTVGISDHAQELLGDIVFVELPDIGINIGKKDDIAVVESVKAASDVYSPVSGEVTEINEVLNDNPEVINTKQQIWVTAHSDVDQLLKGNSRRDVPEDRRKLNDIQLSYVDQLVEENRVKQVFNNFFFTKADSRHPEIAGVAGSFMGSLFTLFTVFILSFPIAIGASVYLEEFAPKNRITELIEVNISNLAAVPSIVFGLLGLGVLLNVFGLPRSTPLVGGSVLALMTLPTIIIACRASLKAVPPSIKEGALAVGATKTQAVFHHVVPLALPGTLTGTIIGLAQALGETAPLIMIGMIAFIPNIPTGLTEPSAALPVQIYLWVESAERGFQEKSAAAIMVILIFLFMMNAIAVFLRNRFERKW